MGKSTTGKCWIGFDLGGTKMLAEVFDSEDRVTGKNRRKTRGNGEGEKPMDRIVGTIDAALSDAGRSREDLAGIGMGVPGPLDIEKGILLESFNLGWDALPLKATLEKVFKCPVSVANDVDAGVYGEYRFGAAAGARCAVGLFPGTGVGGGCVYEGRILRGQRHSCFEIGHCQVMPDGPLCGCGQRGCLEAVASRLAVSSAVAAAAFRGEAPHLLAAQGTDLSRIRSKALATAIAEGDRAVELIVRDAARWLGVGVATAVSLVAPDIVVLGGGMVEAMPEIFLEETRRSARARVMETLRPSFKVCIARLGDSAATLGAAAWARACVEKTSGRA